LIASLFLVAIEQHEPPLLLSTDAYHAEALAVEVAALLGSTLIAPTIQVWLLETSSALSRHYLI